jgi:acyl-CoA reductase-like NAD-dependent aldehyde dehydrogenase
MSDGSTRTLPVRNPRTGQTDLQLPVASAAEVAAQAARPRANQVAWAARPLAERVQCMRRWAGELVAGAKAIGAADGADTGGCHTSQFTAFIAVANINGWVEDAEAAMARATVSGRSVTMPEVEIRSQLVPYALVGKARQVTLNDVNPLQGHIGPFIFVRQPAIVEAHLQDAIAKGAKVLTGGVTETLGGGLYMRPTVMTEVTHAMQIMRDETFGPILPVMRFRTVDEAVQLANDTEYGLTASVIRGLGARARGRIPSCDFCAARPS